MITTKLASIASEACGTSFSKQCDILQKITNLWEQGKNVVVIEGEQVTSCGTVRCELQCICDMFY